MLHHLEEFFHLYSFTTFGVQNQGDLVGFAVFLVVVLKTLHQLLQRPFFLCLRPLLLKENLSKILISVHFPPMQIHFVILPLKITTFDQTLKNFGWNEMFFLFLPIQFDQFIQKFILLELKRLQSAIGTFILYFLHMRVTHHVFASGASDRYFDSFKANNTVIFALVGGRRNAERFLHPLLGAYISKMIISNSFSYLYNHIKWI